MGFPFPIAKFNNTCHIRLGVRRHGSEHTSGASLKPHVRQMCPDVALFLYPRGVLFAISP